MRIEFALTVIWILALAAGAVATASTHQPRERGEETSRAR